MIGFHIVIIIDSNGFNRKVFVGIVRFFCSTFISANNYNHVPYFYLIKKCLCISSIFNPKPIRMLIFDYFKRFLVFFYFLFITWIFNIVYRT